MPTKTLVDTDSTQTLTNKTLTAPVVTAGTIALAAAPTSTLDAATKGYVDGLNAQPLINASLAASVSGNALTFSLKTATGSTPSASDPVRIVFRNGTDTDGSLVTRSVTGATTFTLASGSTLGTANNVPARLWVGLLDNAGTVELCAWNPYVNDSLSLKAFTPNTDVTTTAEGPGTATSAQVLYSSSARSAVPFVLLGFIEITEASAGVWATSPTVVQTYREGMRKTGDTVQALVLLDGSAASGSTTLPDDTSIPQSNEGVQFMSLAITPTSTINLLDIQHIGMYTSSNNLNAGITGALFQDSTADAISAIKAGRVSTADTGCTIVLRHRMRAATVSATTFKIRAGTNGAGTTRFNSDSGGTLYGGVIGSYLTINEIYV